MIKEAKFVDASITFDSNQIERDDKADKKQQYCSCKHDDHSDDIKQH